MATQLHSQRLLLVHASIGRNELHRRTVRRRARFHAHFGHDLALLLHHAHTLLQEAFRGCDHRRLHSHHAFSIVQREFQRASLNHQQLVAVHVARIHLPSVHLKHLVHRTRYRPSLSRRVQRLRHELLPLLADALQLAHHTSHQRRRRDLVLGHDGVLLRVKRVALGQVLAAAQNQSLC